MMSGMKIARVSFVIVGMLMVGGAAVSQQGSSRRVERIAPRFDPRTMDMERAEAAGKLTKHHEMLAKLVGTWRSKTEVFIMGRDPIENMGTAEVRTILDGKFIEIKSKGTLMGMQVRGKTTIGFDVYMNHYSASMLSSMSTGMQMSTGLASPDGAVLVLYGNQPDAARGLTDRLVRTVIRMVDEDNWVWEVHDMYAGPGGAKVMETTYTR